ncbi:hypothetical protein J6590_027716 [Homalodisca vitripennis]|nr:hypothetical protein J6590_027716 [Homalodisca vitripennis]
MFRTAVENGKVQPVQLFGPAVMVVLCEDLEGLESIPLALWNMAYGTDRPPPPSPPSWYSQSSTSSSRLT